MDQINKVKSLSIWIFIIPFVAVNTCLILITQFQGLFPNQEDIIHNTIPYFDGGTSISRTARPYPSWLVFKPSMFLTSYLCFSLLQVSFSYYLPLFIEPPYFFLTTTFLFLSPVLTLPAPADGATLLGTTGPFFLVLPC